jgi:LPS export ABC transporter protein LptC
LFETKKIDTFFTGDKNLLEEEEKIYISRRTKVVRFFKLFMPCLTALLLGVGVILFDFETNEDNSFTLANEERGYFEKFRMKNTVFELSEKNNKFSVIKATEVEEKEAGSKIYNLTHPDSQTLDNGKVITLRAERGVYNQNTQDLDLYTDVVGNYDKQIEIKTESATYNFETEKGSGNEKVVGLGETRAFKADRFAFDNKNGVIELWGNVYLKGDDIELKSPHKAILYAHENKMITSQGTVYKAKDIIKGDELTAFFKDTKQFEIEKAYSKGHTEIYTAGKSIFADRGEYIKEEGMARLFDNVKIVDSSGYTATGNNGIYDLNKRVFTLIGYVTITDKSGYTATAKSGVYDMEKKTITLRDDVQIVKNESTVTAPKAVYFQTKDEFHFYDKVKVEQEGYEATAKSGVYFVKKNVAELNDDVIITKNGNQVRGDKAISDFVTSKSRLVPTKKGGRVFGKLFESTFKKKSGGK